MRIEYHTIAIMLIIYYAIYYNRNNKNKEIRMKHNHDDPTKKCNCHRTYWRNLMDSVQNKISRGAHNIFRTISWARNENWRRQDKKNKK